MGDLSQRQDVEDISTTRFKVEREINTIRFHQTENAVTARWKHRIASTRPNISHCDFYLVYLFCCYTIASIPPHRIQIDGVYTDKS